VPGKPRAQATKRTSHNRGDEPGVRLGAEAHRRVQPFVGEIDQAFAEFDVDAQVQQLLQHLRKARQHHLLAECRGHLDPQVPARQCARLGELVLGLLQIRHHLATALEKGQAVVRQPHAAGRAVQQTLAVLLLEPGNGLAHPGGGQSEPLGSGSEAAGLGDLQEHAESVQVFHGN